MRISVKRTGGLAGLTTRWVVEIGPDELERDWLGVIEACPWADVAGEENQPDRYLYDIRAGDRQATLTERQVTGPWLDLVDRTRQAAGRRPGS